MKPHYEPYFVAGFSYLEPLCSARALMLLVVPWLAAAARVALGANAAAVVLASSSLEATERACPLPVHK